MNDSPTRYAGQNIGTPLPIRSRSRISPILVFSDHWLPHTVIMGMSVNAKHVGYFRPYDHWWSRWDLIRNLCYDVCHTTSKYCDPYKILLSRVATLSLKRKLWEESVALPSWHLWFQLRWIDVHFSTFALKEMAMHSFSFHLWWTTKAYSLQNCRDVIWAQWMDFSIDGWIYGWILECRHNSVT